MRIGINVKNIMIKTNFFHLYFSNVHISVNNEYENIKLRVRLPYIHGERTLSQISSLCPSFNFM